MADWKKRQDLQRNPMTLRERLSSCFMFQTSLCHNAPSARYVKAVVRLLHCDSGAEPKPNDALGIWVSFDETQPSCIRG